MASESHRLSKCVLSLGGPCIRRIRFCGYNVPFNQVLIVLCHFYSSLLQTSLSFIPNLKAATFWSGESRHTQAIRGLERYSLTSQVLSVLWVLTALRPEEKSPVELSGLRRLPMPPASNTACGIMTSQQHQFQSSADSMACINQRCIGIRLHMNLEPVLQFHRRC